MSLEKNADKKRVAFVSLRLSVCISKYDMVKPMWL